MSWVYSQKLTASDASPGDYFGSSVHVSGGFTFIGAPNTDDNSGAVYVYKRDGINWIESQKLSVTNGESFGASVSRSGDRALISVYENNSSTFAHVFEWDGVEWVQNQELMASDGFLGSASTVNLSGNHAFIGASFYDDLSGVVYTFN